MTPIPCNTSFHKWKDKLRRITEMDGQCRHLLKCLDRAIDATRRAAPRGKPGPHPLARTPRQHLEHGQWRECHWEEALWRKYGDGASDPAVPGLWARILSYQVMLRNENDVDAGWGEIDLLAVTKSGLPAVIELKGETCREPPLRMIIEGCAYGIALEASDVFAQQFQQALKTRFGTQITSRDGQAIPVICVAPCAYWLRCFGIERESVRSAWPLMKKLIGAMGAKGIAVILAEIHHDGTDAVGLPNITGVAPIQLPIEVSE